MRRVWFAFALALVPATAAAETQLGGFFGPRIFGGDAQLGYIDNLPAHPSLKNSVGFGIRVGKPFGFPWLVPELEAVVVPTGTDSPCLGMTCLKPADVVWLEPRFQLRIELAPQRRVEPFLLVGGGAPIALSAARKSFNSGVSGEGYVGAGVRLDTLKGFVLRIDGRFAVQPAAAETDKNVTFEGDVTLGIELRIGGPKRRRPTEPVVVQAPPPDRDGDGILDADDKCPDRPEDTDNFEDGDGCPDIDNDLDRVLDIADKCPTEVETLNGYADDDGCADSVPADVEELKGSIEGLLYAEGETVVRDSAMKYLAKIVKVMTDHPSIKVVLVGHTDDREANAFITPAAQGAPPPDVTAIATDLARARAEAVRQALVSQGIPSGRFVIDGVGAEEPVADNATPKGRLANRRVEIKLFVPR